MSDEPVTVMCWGCLPEYGQPWDCTADDVPPDPLEDHAEQSGCER